MFFSVPEANHVYLHMFHCFTNQHVTHDICVAWNLNFFGLILSQYAFPHFTNQIQECFFYHQRVLNFDPSPSTILVRVKCVRPAEQLRQDTISKIVVGFQKFTLALTNKNRRIPTRRKKFGEPSYPLHYAGPSEASELGKLTSFQIPTHLSLRKLTRFPSSEFWVIFSFSPLASKC